MTAQDKTLNTEPTLTDCVIAPLSDIANQSDDRISRKRSAFDDNAADKKRGSGGLDSLGGGRLP